MKDAPEELPAMLQPHFGPLEQVREEKRSLRLDPAHTIHAPHDPSVGIPQQQVDQKRA